MGIWSCLELQRCGLGESVLPSGMKKYTQQTVVGIFLVFAAMIGGCSTTLPPTFSAESIRELESFEGRTRMVFIINAQNPNKDPIPLEQAIYSVAIGGENVYSGLRSPEVTLPGYSSLSFELPAVVDSQMLRVGRDVQYMILGSVKYHVPGVLADVLYDADLKIPEAPLAIHGVISLGEED